MLTMFLSWLRGYVVLHISGGAPERLLNLALQRDIDIYDINWLTDDLLEVNGWPIWRRWWRFPIHLDKWNVRQF